MPIIIIHPCSNIEKRKEAISYYFNLSSEAAERLARTQEPISMRDNHCMKALEYTREKYFNDDKNLIEFKPNGFENKLKS